MYRWFESSVLYQNPKYIHPRANFTEARKRKDVGEVTYMRDAGREAQELLIKWISYE